MPGLPRSALLVAWGNAWLLGAASVAEVVTRVQRADEPHDVAWPAGSDAAASEDLAAALTRLRQGTRADGLDGVDGLRLALPVPGHPVGGAPGLAAAALDAGEAVLAIRRGLPERLVAGLVPAVRAFGPPGDQGHLVTWAVHQALDAPPVVPAAGLAEADRALREALLDAAATLQPVGVAAAGDRPEVAQLLDDLRSRRGEQVLPLPYGPRAQDVAARAVRLLAVVRAAEPGTALTAHATEARRRSLGPLAGAARHALVAACDSVLEPVRR